MSDPIPQGKAHICHLTVLNPARHSRIFYKEARSQVEAGYRVTVVGQNPAAESFYEDGVKIVPTGVFGRLSGRRWQARKAIIRLAAEQNADLYQIHAPELLGPAKQLLQLVPGCKLLYDMHEDYALNIRHGGYYPRVLSGPLSQWVRKREESFVKYGHGVVYAEQCFSDILAFPPERSAVIANKFQPPSEVTEPPEFGDPRLPLLLCNGTLAANWGVLRSIELWSKLQDLLPCRLAVVGHTHDEDFLQEIRKSAAHSGHADRFRLVGGKAYVPYEEMVGWIRKADFGLALYDLRANIRDRMPTKFYEFMATGKPVIFTSNPAWKSFFSDTGMGFPASWPLEEEQLAAIAAFMRKSPDAKRIIPEEKWSWESEAKRLLGLIDGILQA